MSCIRAWNANACSLAAKIGGGAFGRLVLTADMALTKAEDSQAAIQRVVGETGALEVVPLAAEDEADVDVAAIEDIEDSDA